MNTDDRLDYCRLMHKDRFIYTPFILDIPQLRDRQLEYLVWRFERASYVGKLAEAIKYERRYNKLLVTPIRW